MSPLLVRRCAIEAPDARKLVGELDAELTAMYPDPGTRHFRLDPFEVSGGNGAFLVARLDGEPAGCGAVRSLGGGDFEIKRMFVVPAFRRRGVARAVLAALEAEALRLRGRRVVLETGVRSAEALALYRGEGYSPIPPYGEYLGSPVSVCLAKSLDRAP